MATLAELQAFRAALVAARSNGIRSVRDSSGETIEYKSDGEMKSAIAFIDSEIAAATGGPRASTIRFATSKGL